MAKRPPHGGKTPGQLKRKPTKRGPKENRLIIEDIDEALKRIWQAKPKKT